MENDNFSDKVLSDYIKRYEEAINHVFKDYPKQPSIYSHERQKYSGLNYETLKERLNGRKRGNKS